MIEPTVLFANAIKVDTKVFLVSELRFRIVNVWKLKTFYFSMLKTEKHIISEIVVAVDYFLWWDNLKKIHILFLLLQQPWSMHKLLMKTYSIDCKYNAQLWSKSYIHSSIFCNKLYFTTPKSSSI